MWKPNPLVDSLERSCDLKAPPVVGHWYSVPTYPFKANDGKFHHLPVYLPAHEDQKAFGFRPWHYHVDLRFVHQNEICFLLEKHVGVARKYYTRYLYIPSESPYVEIADKLPNGQNVMAAWEHGITDQEVIFESWYKCLCDRFLLAVTQSQGFIASADGTDARVATGFDADFRQIKWKAQPCIRASQEPNSVFLHNILCKLDRFKKVAKYCGKCPHKGVNLDSVEADENGIKICPAHGARWKVEKDTITITGEAKRYSSEF